MAVRKNKSILLMFDKLFVVFFMNRSIVFILPFVWKSTSFNKIIKYIYIFIYFEIESRNGNTVVMIIFAAMPSGPDELFLLTLWR